MNESIVSEYRQQIQDLKSERELARQRIDELETQVDTLHRLNNAILSISLRRKYLLDVFRDTMKAAMRDLLEQTISGYTHAQRNRLNRDIARNLRDTAAIKTPMEATDLDDIPF